MPHFGSIAFKKVAAGGDIEEQVFHGDISAISRCNRLLFPDGAVLDGYISARFIFSSFGPYLHLCHSCDRSEGFTTETHGLDLKEVFNSMYLGSGVPFKTHTGI